MYARALLHFRTSYLTAAFSVGQVRIVVRGHLQEKYKFRNCQHTRRRNNFASVNG